jgi:uncharacterized protein YaeQ
LALGATLYAFDIEINDVDRGTYTTLNLRVAQHPSETLDYLVTRVLAYCLEYAEGIEFSKGLSDPDQPALFVRDLTGTLLTWIDIGLPEPERLHRASKASPRVAVYTHKDPAQWALRLAGARIYRANELELFAFDPAWIARIAARLERRMKISLARSESQIYLNWGDESLQTALELVAPWQ